jgi:hypothetical protein
MPGKGPDTDAGTKTKPLTWALANGHGRHVAVTPEWARLSVGGWPSHAAAAAIITVCLLNGHARAISILKPPRGGYRNEIRTNSHLDPEVVTNPLELLKAKAL